MNSILEIKNDRNLLYLFYVSHKCELFQCESIFGIMNTFINQLRSTELVGKPLYLHSYAQSDGRFNVNVLSFYYNNVGSKVIS